ncbi:hypothetical protein WA158_005952 [Blastocystis sp. Blastoise]
MPRDIQLESVLDPKKYVEEGMITFHGKEGKLHCSISKERLVLYPESEFYKIWLKGDDNGTKEFSTGCPERNLDLIIYHMKGNRIDIDMKSNDDLILLSKDFSAMKLNVPDYITNRISNEKWNDGSKGIYCYLAKNDQCDSNIQDNNNKDDNNDKEDNNNKEDNNKDDNNNKEDNKEDNNNNKEDNNNNKDDNKDYNDNKEDNKEDNDNKNNNDNKEDANKEDNKEDNNNNKEDNNNNKEDNNKEDDNKEDDNKEDNKDNNNKEDNNKKDNNNNKEDNKDNNNKEDNKDNNNKEDNKDNNNNNASISMSTSIGFEDSSIITMNDDYLNIFINWFGKEKKWKLLFRASEHNYLASEFHKYCDYEGETITIIKHIGHDNKINIFGGYTNQNWESNESICQSYSKEFLFTLSNEHNIPPTQYLYTDTNKGYGITCSSLWGPTFGYADIYIADNCHNNNDSTCHAYSYGIINTSQKSSLFVNTNDCDTANLFTVEDYEVWRINE